MYNLYHQTLCPFSKKIRFLLSQKDIPFNLIKENFWERRKEFLALNPANSVPVLFDQNSHNAICGSSVIVEYIEEKHDDSTNYLGISLIKKAETRRIQLWFDEKFFNEVTKYILEERFFNRFLSNSKPIDPDNLRIAKYNLNVHLSYIEFLLENRKYLAGDHISIADFAASGHISTLDYFGDIDWQNYPTAKDWYSIVKSQKGFFEILKDTIPSIPPSAQYNKLDF